jgi:hypothetical protein
MFLESGAARGGGRGPQWRVHYADEQITVTSWYVETGGRRFAIVELRGPVRVLSYPYPIAKVSMITGGLELVIATPIAVTHGSAIMAGAGVLAAAGMLLGLWADVRRNPRFMEIRATVRGHVVAIYRTRDQRKFGQVRRALIRAIEDNGGPRP